MIAKQIQEQTDAAQRTKEAEIQTSMYWSDEEDGFKTCTACKRNSNSISLPKTLQGFKREHTFRIKSNRRNANTNAMRI